MMRPDANVAVFVCVTPVDMRKQASTLALIVEQTLKRNIFEPALYVFSDERRDRLKIVYWQKNGLCLWSKRLATHISTDVQKRICGRGPACPQHPCELRIE